MTLSFFYRNSSAKVQHPMLRLTNGNPSQITSFFAGNSLTSLILHFSQLSSRGKHTVYARLILEEGHASGSCRVNHSGISISTYLL